MRLLLALSLTLGSLARADQDLTDRTDLRMNQLQVIGSHNSYKQPIEPALMDVMRSFERNADALDYAHPSLSDQLNLGLRNLELDVYHDPQGGRFAEPLGIKLLASMGKPHRPFDAYHEMREPGFKVLHGHDFDFRSHNLTLAGALAELKAWSQANPSHLPVIVLINTKYDRHGVPGEVEPLMFDADALKQLDEAILAGLGAEHLITPDLIRGDAPTLREAVTTRGWPRLDAVRGRYAFVLDMGDPVRAIYLEGNEVTAGRVMFATVNADHPAAGIMVINNPVRDESRIRELVKRGFLVRTRADAGTREMRESSLARFDAALRSGAQVVSTDYYLADWRINPDFVIRFAPGVYARAHPDAN